MNVVILTRTGRPTGAAVAAEILKSGHKILAVIAEKRASMLTKKHGIFGLLLKTYRNQGAGFVISKLWDYLLIKINYWLRLFRLKSAGRYLSIEEFLIEHKLPYIVVNDHNAAESVRTIKELHPDMIILANTRIIGAEVIKIPVKGCMNLHLGKLPEYRGTASIFWEMCNGEKKGGISVHFVEEKLDSGDIILEDSIEIQEGDTEASLYEKKLSNGARMVREALDMIEKGDFACKKQDPSKVRMYHWPTKEERAEFRIRRLCN